MALLNELYDKINEERNAVFNYNKWKDRIKERFAELCFLGQIDKDAFYVEQLHQVYKDAEGGQGEIRDLTIEEANEFYLTGDIKSLDDYRPFAWTFWFFNLEKNYVKVITSYHADKSKSPKDNYGIAYEQCATNQFAQGTDKINTEEFKIIDCYYEEEFKKLLDIIKYSKNHEISFANFDKKVHQDMSKYWGMINNKGFVDDKYVETSRPEIIRVGTIQHDKVLIKNDKEFLDKLAGDGFLEVDFDHNGLHRQFKTVKDMNDYFYSMIKFINNNNEIFNINQQINSLEKHYYSNRLGSPTAIVDVDKKVNKMIENIQKEHGLQNRGPITEEEKATIAAMRAEAAKMAEEEVKVNKSLQTLYLVSVQKFLNKIVVQADVQEYGIAYSISNFNGKHFCNYFEAD
jgi:hypothetical protein